MKPHIAGCRRAAYRALGAATIGLLLLAAGATAAPSAKKRPDRTNPTVAISAPSAGAVLSRTISVNGTAADDVGVNRVEVSVDSGPYTMASGTSSWSTTIDTTRSQNGSHTITARATDSSGNTVSRSVAVTFANDTTPPTVAITAPADGATVGGSVTVTGTASDGGGLQKVELRVDDGTFRSATGTGSWTASVDMTAYSNGSHTLTARATDGAGNVSSTSIDVIHSSEAVPPPPLPAGTIGGYLFKESDRDGVYETGEQPLANQHLYLYDGSETYLANTYSDADGWYRFTGRADGSYSVRFDGPSWWDLRYDWVPDTTGSIFPRASVELATSARADIGWRPIVRSTDATAPISSYVGPNGLTVRSYNDVVPAKDVYDRLMTGLLIGQEAPDVMIRLDFTTAGSTSTMASQSNGRYTEYHATSNVSYVSWLDDNGELFHEYGHAWSLYYAYIVQQDPVLTAYLRARGLEGDPRVGSSYAWDPRELIAEDYRQLFGSVSARAETQMNRDLPSAGDVPGLGSFLSGTFTQPPGP